jgi:hypothetical protein
LVAAITVAFGTAPGGVFGEAAGGPMAWVPAGDRRRSASFGYVFEHRNLGPLSTLGCQTGTLTAPSPHSRLKAPAYTWGFSFEAASPLPVPAQIVEKFGVAPPIELPSGH